MASDTPIVLYVDDERPNRIVFEQTFKTLFNLMAVSSAQEALDVLASREVAVLVTDQRMPVMSGNELLKRAKKEYPMTVRIVITAYSDLEPILAAVNEGLVARYLVKPWSREQLEELLRWGLETYRIGKENTSVQLRLIETERLATIGSIHGALIHDLTQPLAYLVNNAEHLAQLVKDLPAGRLDWESTGWDENTVTAVSELIDELPELVDDMLSGCRLLSNLVHNVMVLLGAAQARGSRECKPMPSIKFAMSSCRSLVTAVKGELIYRGPDELPRIAVAESELIQVLVNLLSNAASALERKDPPGCRVTLDVEYGERFLALTIADDGCGMPLDVLQRAGTPFFTTRQKGIGLGLHQCRRIIEGRGGKLLIRSEENVGTSIRLELPMAGTPPPVP